MTGRRRGRLRYRRAGFALALCSIYAAAAPGAPGRGVEYTLAAAAENYRWQEFDQGGERLLTEQGPRYGVGLGLRYAVRGLICDAALTGYTGTVDYDGQDNNGVFTGSSTSYDGWMGEVSVAYRSALTDVSNLDVRAGVGSERWTREIHSGSNALGQPVAGFVEEYAVGYAKLGLGIAHERRGVAGYLDLGAKQSFAVDEDVVINGQDLRLHPGRGRSWYASYRITWASLGRDDYTGSFIRFYYEGLRFEKSPARSVGLVTVWQPESRADVLGVALGVAF